MPRKGSTPRKPSKKVFIAKGARAHIVFSDALTKDIRDLERKRKKQELQDLRKALAFDSWIKVNFPTTLSPTITSFRAPSYRVVYNGRIPNSPAGSLAAGGRLNVGGAQQRSNISSKMCGALYAAGDLATALVEAGPSCNKPEVFRLVPKRDLAIWDLTSVLAVIDDPTITSEVVSTPMSAIWCEQKVPKISQILGGHLRAVGGDGIAFHSTKKPAILNYCFFLSDEQQALATFDFITENP